MRTRIWAVSLEDLHGKLDRKLCRCRARPCVLLCGYRVQPNGNAKRFRKKNRLIIFYWVERICFGGPLSLQFSSSCSNMIDGNISPNLVIPRFLLSLWLMLDQNISMWTLFWCSETHLWSYWHSHTFICKTNEQPEKHVFPASWRKTKLMAS